uniref:Uncharacterized protein n=1 Tax=Tetranychus urticae TaxID=32264 RepID=T1K156_TETUR
MSNHEYEEMTGVLSIKDVVRQKDITKSNAKILGPKKKC